MQISKIIKAYGLTQEEVAFRMGISRQGLANNLQKDNPTLSSLRALATAIGCPITEFFADEVPACPDNSGISAEVTCPHCGKQHQVKITGVSVV